MKFELLLLTLLAHRVLAEVSPINCKVSLKSMLICVYQRCYLTIDQKDIELLNCERKEKGMREVKFVSEGECSETLMPKCRTFDFK